MRKYKLSTILLTLAVIAALLCACYPVMGDDGYRTMPLGTGTDAPVLIETEGSTASEMTSADVTSSFEETSGTESTGDQTTSGSDATCAPDDTTGEQTAPPPAPSFECDVIEKTEVLGQVGAQKCTATFRYPALKNIEDLPKLQSLNELLAQIAEVEYQNRLPNASELVKGGTAVSYEVTDTSVTFLGNDLVSVRSEGRIDYTDDSKDERFVYCNLIKLSTGKDITLKKTYSDFEGVIALFKSGRFTQLSGEPSLTSSVTLEKLMEPYKYHSQYGTFPETYFTSDSLVIVIETSRENGHFAEFGISLDQVNDCLILSPTK